MISLNMRNRLYCNFLTIDIPQSPKLSGGNERRTHVLLFFITPHVFSSFASIPTPRPFLYNISSMKNDFVSQYACCFELHQPLLTIDLNRRSSQRSFPFLYKRCPLIFPPPPLPSPFRNFVPRRYQVSVLFLSHHSSVHFKTCTPVGTKFQHFKTDPYFNIIIHSVRPISIIIHSIRPISTNISCI